MTSETLQAETPQATSFHEAVERLRERARVNKRPDDDLDDLTPPPGESTEFVFSRDEKNREVATPVKTISEQRAARWARVCLAFDYSQGLVHESLLQTKQQQLREKLAMGRKNAILFGPPGTGKTTVAMWALYDLHMAGRHVKASRFSQFKTQMEPRWLEANNVSAEDVAIRYREPDYLFLDELGYGDTRQTISEHELRIFFDLVSVRDSMGRRTWIGSNVERVVLYELYGAAALSRIDAVGKCLAIDFEKDQNFRMTSPPRGAL